MQLAQLYKGVGKEFGGTVNHLDYEWARGDIYTNTVEGCYSIFKRGMKGVYQHCKEKHLYRYLAEFDFRYSNRVALGIEDEARANRAMLGRNQDEVGAKGTGQNPLKWPR